MSNELAADTANGVYICENAAAAQHGKEVLVEDDFYFALLEVKDGETIFGQVSDELAERIEAEFGIR